jgi:hypothetical protein
MGRQIGIRPVNTTPAFRAPGGSGARRGGGSAARAWHDPVGRATSPFDAGVCDGRGDAWPHVRYGGKALAEATDSLAVFGI